ncbi:MAG: alanine racemase [Saprospiraceae bacterium]|nr:alanine racemase [Saprospiraceae bacterium]
MAAIEHNIGVYKNLLKPETKIMAVIKGSAYGSGAEAIGQLLQHKGIDYLSVANADEAKQLRNAGVTMPIVVLNPDGLFCSRSFEIQLRTRGVQFATIAKYHCRFVPIFRSIADPHQIRHGHAPIRISRIRFRSIDQAALRQQRSIGCKEYFFTFG